MGRFILGIVFTAFFASDASATLCEVKTKGDNNEVVVELRDPVENGIPFWVWPNRNAIRIESVDRNGKRPVDIQVKDQAGEQTFRTDEFYIYSADKKSFRDCVDVAFKASEDGLGIRVTLRNTSAGYYSPNPCDGHNWAAFEPNQFICESIK